MKYFTATFLVSLLFTIPALAADDADTSSSNMQGQMMGPGNGTNMGKGMGMGTGMGGQMMGQGMMQMQKMQALMNEIHQQHDPQKAWV